MALNQLIQWCADHFTLPTVNLDTVSGDASFRTYYRFAVDDQSYIAVSAPPATEKNREFVAIAGLLRSADILAPEVIAVDYENGFLLLSDLGDQLLLPLLRPDSVDRWYTKALDELIKLQAIPRTRAAVLACYDAPTLQRELDVCPEWYLGGLLGLKLDETDRSVLALTDRILIEAALAQPQCVVHRDYHARNLMCVDTDLGMIDFQDALWGPASYDVVSLIKDCYVAWPRQKVLEWLAYYHAQSPLPLAAFEVFVRQFDLLGMQRHIKVLGVFARLSLRDEKHGYLRDLPRVMHYVIDVAERYPELSEFYDWFQARVLPLAQQQVWFNSEEVAH